MCVSQNTHEQDNQTFTVLCGGALNALILFFVIFSAFIFFENEQLFLYNCNC